MRTNWDEEQEEWYFSIVDVVAVLTDISLQSIGVIRCKDKKINETMTKFGG